MKVNLEVLNLVINFSSSLVSCVQEFKTLCFHWQIKIFCPNLELWVCFICTETKYVVQCSNYVRIVKLFSVYTHV